MDFYTKKMHLGSISDFEDKPKDQMKNKKKQSESNNKKENAINE